MCVGAQAQVGTEYPTWTKVVGGAAAPPSTQKHFGASSTDTKTKGGEAVMR